jgi:hypothetical protein
LVVRDLLEKGVEEFRKHVAEVPMVVLLQLVRNGEGGEHLPRGLEAVI